MLASLLLFPTMCLPCDADSTHRAFKPTKNWSFLFAKQFFILPLHCWDLLVIASKAFPWPWKAPITTGWNSAHLGQALPHLLPWVLTASYPRGGLCWGGSFGSSKAEPGFQQSSAEFHISFNILHFRHKTSLGKMMKPYPRTPQGIYHQAFIFELKLAKNLHCEDVSTEVCQFQTRLTTKTWMSAKIWNWKR